MSILKSILSTLYNAVLLLIIILVMIPVKEKILIPFVKEHTTIAGVLAVIGLLIVGYCVSNMKCKD